MTNALIPSQRATLDETGAVMVEVSLDLTDICAALGSQRSSNTAGAGQRFFGAPPTLKPHLDHSGALGQIARTALSNAARPTRMIVFDKSPEANWAVGWHQDRTIAVKARAERPGYQVWSKKGGIPHVEPPFNIIERTISLRLHLDDTPDDNAPLMTVTGSHQLGKIASENANALAMAREILIHTARAGDLLVLRTPVLHASRRAERPGRRRVLHIDFCDAVLPAPLEWAFDWEPAHV